VGVGSGTDALWLALLALGVGPGDEVITVPDTFIATAEAITYCGATPVFVDVDEKSYNMDPNRLEDYLKTQNSKLKPKNRLKAIIPVHLFGQTADMDQILDIARKYGLSVVEDACQAHGSLYKGKPAGSMGDAGCFSFYPGKNLGAYGEAGAVVTNNAELANKMRMIRDHGQEKIYYHGCIGWNARMDGIQGAVLSVKLKHLPAWNEARRKNAEMYNGLLHGSDGIFTPQQMEWAQHVYHIYAIRAQNRDTLISKLGEKGVNCGIHYPVPVHLQNAYQSLGLKPGSFPVAEQCASEFVSLPMFPELSPDQIHYVADEVKASVSNPKS
jgi:dTDP-4-amino-4,6-dideoxygalactose transaminase